MGGFDGHSGTSKLAVVLSRRMKRENEVSMVLDFGEIQENGSLITNTFPVPIPKGDYSVCRHFMEHQAAIPGIRNNNRVLVAWVQNEAVVVDIIENS